MKDKFLKKILGLFGLTKDDIRCSLMSESGADVKLMSLTARKLFPYSVECKNREVYRTLYKHYKQCQKHTNLEPLLIIKMNQEKPLSIVSMEHLFNLLDEI